MWSKWVVPVLHADENRKPTVNLLFGGWETLIGITVCYSSLSLLLCHYFHLLPLWLHPPFLLFSLARPPLPSKCFQPHRSCVYTRQRGEREEHLLQDVKEVWDLLVNGSVPVGHQHIWKQATQNITHRFVEERGGGSSSLQCYFSIFIHSCCWSDWNRPGSKFWFVIITKIKDII